MSRPCLMRWMARGIVALLLVLTGGFWAWRHATDNFGVVISGPSPVYRSDQMDPEMLRIVIRELGIRTVVNLRGPNPGESWYDDERATTLANGATQIDLPLSSCDWMSRPQALTLAQTLKDAPRPLLIHCFHGSERTGLASSMIRLLTEGQTVEDAAKAFSWRYLYFGLGDGVVSQRQFEQYQHWLELNQKKHSPDLYMTWLRTGFTPGSPSREAWPYDPYPLLIRSVPPAAGAQMARQQAHEEPTRK